MNSKRKITVDEFDKAFMQVAEDVIDEMHSDGVSPTEALKSVLMSSHLVATMRHRLFPQGAETKDEEDD